jgi:uncharacterized protein YbjT (DUF2867 family)
VILVTGATGNAGGAVVRALVNAGERVRAVGRALRFEGQTNEEARAQMNPAMPAEYVDAFFRFFAHGDLDESEVLPTVQEVTGRAPRTFEAWARAHADAFR